MSAKTRDSRAVSRSSGKPLEDRRAVVGSSGRPEKGMVLDSGAKQIAEVLGRHDRASGPAGRQAIRTTGGMRFDVDAMKDHSIGRLDEGSALGEQFGGEAQPGLAKPVGSVVSDPTAGGRKGER